MFAFTHRDVDSWFMSAAARVGWDGAVSVIKKCAQEMLNSRPGDKVTLSENNWFTVNDVKLINMVDGKALLAAVRKSDS